MPNTIGTIICIPISYAPRDWSFCEGQILTIASNMALFSLLGTTYGGDGVTTFALPDLRGRTPISAGQSDDGPFYTLGQKTGAESTTLALNNLASHVHTGPVTLHLNANSNDGVITRATQTFPAQLPGAYGTVSNALMAAPAYTGSFGVSTGGTSPITTRTPFLAMNYFICFSGVFPTP